MQHKLFSFCVVDLSKYKGPRYHLGAESEATKDEMSLHKCDSLVGGTGPFQEGNDQSSSLWVN